MADFTFNIAKRGLADGTIDLDTNVIKMLLLKAKNTDAVMKDLARIATLFDGTTLECTATGYAGGFAGASRQTLTITASTNNTDDRGDFALSADVTFPTIGGASNDVLVGVVMYKHITDDATSVPIAFFDLTSLPAANRTTNGGNIVLTWPTDGATARCLLKMIDG